VTQRWVQPADRQRRHAGPEQLDLPAADRILELVGAGEVRHQALEPQVLALVALEPVEQRRHVARQHAQP